MEKKLAERLAAKAAAGELSGEMVRSSEDEPSPGEKDSLAVPSSKQPPPWKSEVEPAPDSGVRSSIEDPPRDLTYSVYTVADLEARGQTRPPRMSMAFAPALPPPPSRWTEVGKAALVLLRAAWMLARTPKPRPRIQDVCQVPFQLFVTELKISLRALPWRKLAIGGGIAFGSLLVLLFIVLTAAELTDDLKPARTSARMASEANAATSALASPTMAPTVAPTAAKVEAKPAAPSPEPAQTIEIDEETPPAAKAPAKPKAKKPAATKKKTELFNP